MSFVARKHQFKMFSAHNFLRFFMVMLFTATSLNACSHIGEKPDGLHKTQSVKIIGKVSILGNPSSKKDVSVSINGERAIVTTQGMYSATVEPSDIYQIRVTGNGVFESFHTFYTKFADASLVLNVIVWLKWFFL